MRQHTRTYSFALACFLASVVVGLGGGNELVHGDFDEPDHESWSGSGWASWTPVEVSGRPTWADHVASGRGAAGYGWNDGSDMGIYQDISAAANVLYTYTIWVRKEVNYNEDITQLNIEWLDTGLNWLGDNIYSNITGQATPTYTQLRSPAALRTPPVLSPARWSTRAGIRRSPTKPPPSSSTTPRWWLRLRPSSSSSSAWGHARYTVPCRV